MGRLVLEPGKRYERKAVQAQIAGLTAEGKGGSPQWGIAFDHHARVGLFFTGSPHSKDFYGDGWLDNLFLYSGQGQSGDMAWLPFNAPLLMHEERDVELHGFHKSPSKRHTKSDAEPEPSYVYLGKFHCIGYIPETTEGADGKLRQAFTFILQPTGTTIQGPGPAPQRYRLPEWRTKIDQAIEAFAAGERPLESDPALLKALKRRQRLAKKVKTDKAPGKSKRRQFPKDITGPTDGVSWRTYRREQRRLKEYLLSEGESPTCAICGRSFPQDFLVAAHLKPRRYCSEEERRDFYVVRLMCKAGCDQMYESRLITVKDGVVVSGRSIADSFAIPISDLIESVLGRDVPNWEESSTYYDWHYEAAMNHTPLSK